MSCGGYFKPNREKKTKHSAVRNLSALHVRVWDPFCFNQAANNFRFSIEISVLSNLIDCSNRLGFIFINTEANSRHALHHSSLYSCMAHEYKFLFLKAKNRKTNLIAH